MKLMSILDLLIQEGRMGKSQRPRPKRLAEKLVQIRISLDLSQNELVERLDYKGDLTRGMISNFELDRREPPLEVLLAYARAGSVSVESIIDDENDLLIVRNS